MKLTFTLSLSLLLLGGCSKSNYEKDLPVRPVKMIEVSAGSIFEKDFQGTIASDKESRLGFRSTGQIIELAVEEGDFVSKGDLIAALDDKDFQNQLIADRTAFETAQTQYERNKRLSAKEAISDQDLEVSRINLERARAAYENSKSQLQDLKIYAPFDGIIEERQVVNFQRVSAGQEIVKLVDTKDLIVKFTVADKNINYLQLDPEFIVTIDILPEKKFKAKIRNYINASTSGFGIPVKLEINDPEFKNYLDQIKPGFAASIHMKVMDGESSGKIIIPNTAIASDPVDKQPYVWVIDPELMQVSRQDISINRMVETDQVEVTQGLSQGATIVFAGVNRLQEGQKVKKIANN